MQKSFQVITQSKIDAYRKTLLDSGLDLSQTRIHVLNPGDDLFDLQEIKFKYSFHADDPRFDELRDLIGAYEQNPAGLSVGTIRKTAIEKGIVLDGRLPGFALSQEDEIFYLAVQNDDAISMAQNYARKRGDGRVFSTIDEAKVYLNHLAEESFLHESGHIAYAKIRQSDISDIQAWEYFVESNAELKSKVIMIQLDKYPDPSQIPVAEEAFADFFVNVGSKGKIISRLGDDPQYSGVVEEMVGKLKQ